MRKLSGLRPSIVGNQVLVYKAVPNRANLSERLLTTELDRRRSRLVDVGFIDGVNSFT